MVATRTSQLAIVTAMRITHKIIGLVRQCLVGPWHCRQVSICTGFAGGLSLWQIAHLIPEPPFWMKKAIDPTSLVTRYSHQHLAEVPALQHAKE